MKKYKFYFITLVICFISVTGCAQKGSLEGVYVVKNVVDGDTIELVGGEKVRYVGIDTPETMKRLGKNWVFDPEDYAVSAKELNKALVSGAEVRLEFDLEKTDRYGRLLAYVYDDDGAMINKELVSAGLAMVYTFQPNVKHMDILLKTQEEARRNKRGLWSTLEVISPAEAGSHVGSYRAVRGEVTGVYARGNKVFLTIEGKLTAVIYRGNLEFFDQQGIDPMGYSGKNVEIVGKIEAKGGPQIVIDNPSQIRII
jgi:endonuclease YncB( thermonuclease family)